MKHLIKSIFLLAIFTIPVSTEASKPVNALLESPCFITFLSAGQTAPGTARVDWLSSVDGPYIIEVVDLATDQVVYLNTNSFDNSEIIPNLPNGDYIVTVTDADNADSVKFSIN